MVGNGHSVKFWLDRWTGQCALQTVYPNLFSIVYDQNILVSQVCSANGIQIEVARQLVGVYYDEWCALLGQFQHFTLGIDNDQISLRWSTTGKKFVHSLYTWLEMGGY